MLEVAYLVQDDLWGHVLWCSADGPRAVRHALGKAKVDDLEVSLGVEEQVLRLEVTVDDLLIV